MKKYYSLLLLSLISLIGVENAMPLAEPDRRGELQWLLQAGRDYVGALLQGVYDPTIKASCLATSARIYKIQEGKAKQIVDRPDTSSRVTLAPGGDIYAVMTQMPAWKGLFSVNIFNMAGDHLCELKIKEAPYGFGTLYLGFKGKLIVTLTPLDDWQGLSGRFKVIFWNLKGEILRDIVLEGLQTGIIDHFGEAILFLGEKEARSYTATGKEIWQLKGKYRKAALSAGGKLAYLNPSATKNVGQVIIFRVGGETSALMMPTPVHGLVVVPDGSYGIVIGDRGRYFHLDTSSAKLKEAKKLPIDGTYFIFNSTFVDEQTIAFGLLERSGKPPKERWTKGDIIIVDKEDRVLFKKEFPIHRAVSLYPAVLTTFGSHHIIGLTEETAILIELKK